MVTRRQFGLWTGSALLIGPAMAKEVAAGGFAALELTAVLVTADPADPAALVAHTEQTLVDVTVKNPTKDGVSLAVDVVKATVRHGDQTSEVMGWMNDRNPMSRRVRMPDYVDLAAGQSTLAGRAKVAIPPELRDAAGATLTLRLRIFGQLDEEAREVELPPIPLAPEEAKS